MSKLTELKAFIDDQSDMNCNVVYPMVNAVVAEVDEDVLTYKTVGNTEATPSGVTPITIGTTVAFSTATSGATIYYTVDGSTPDNTDLVYSAPIAVTEDITFKTIAYKGYQTPSTPQTHTFQIDLAATPVANPAAGAVADNTEVTLTCATEGSTIYYTDDGSEPTDESTEYTEAIVITDPVTIKAIAYAPTYKPSLVLTAAYTIAA